MANSVAESWKNPDIRKRRNDAQKAAQTEEVKAKRSEIAKAM
jgi:hypothetical protein